MLKAKVLENDLKIEDRFSMSSFIYYEPFVLKQQLRTLVYLHTLHGEQTNIQKMRHL